MWFSYPRIMYKKIIYPHRLPYTFVRIMPIIPWNVYASCTETERKSYSREQISSKSQIGQKIPDNFPKNMGLTFDHRNKLNKLNKWNKRMKLKKLYYFHHANIETIYYLLFSRINYKYMSNGTNKRQTRNQWSILQIQNAQNSFFTIVSWESLGL
jgi:hypothetical protein